MVRSSYSHKVHVSLASALAFASIILLSLLTPLTFYATNRLELYNAAVDRTYDAQQILSDLAADLSSLDASEQGYLLTQDDTYVASIDTAKKHIYAALTRAKSCAKDDPALRRRMRAITQTVSVRLRSARTTSSENDGSPEVPSRLQARLAQAARTQIAETRAGLEIVLARQMEDVTKRSDETQVLVTADVALVVVVLGLMILIVRHDHSAQVNHYVQIVEEQKRNLEHANRELAELAKRDGLTGLINHRTFHERLATEFVLLARHSEPISLLMIDVDHFKAYNDTFGHQAGDAILARIAQILDDAGRASDVVARYGGEEFAILLPTTGPHGAHELAERLRRRVEADTWQNASVTISIGVSSSTRDATNPTELLAMADRALYRSKALGRNQVTIASPDSEGDGAQTPPSSTRAAAHF
ncbi:MAG: diguanylate cyclase [Capsulimonadaceae bacterium]|nr:diguanylate cyclase [Capsulimonadaceae bacterium]